VMLVNVCKRLKNLLSRRHRKPRVMLTLCENDVYTHLYSSVATIIFGLNGLVRRTSYIQTAKLLDFYNLQKNHGKISFPT